MSTTYLVGPKIPVIDEQNDGSTYGDNMRHVLRMLQALVQCNVINLTTSNPPATPNNGDSYIVASAPTGLWAGQANNLAYWTTDDPNVPGGKWEFYPPFKGWVIGNQADGNLYVYNSTTWVVVGGSAVSAGTNIVPALPIAGLTYGGSSGLAGFTVIMRIPAPFVQAATTAGVKVGIVTTPGSTALVVNSASIGATLLGGTAWTTAPVPFTWPAGSFVNPETIYLSNTCPITVDENHDYYITIYFDPTSSSAGYNFANTTTGNPFAFWQGLTGYLSGNHAADADASLLQAPNGNGLFCIGQVVVA